MTYDQTIAAIVEIDVAKWGESERAASEHTARKNCPSIGLALNWLAQRTGDRAMAAQAKTLLTSEDRRRLRQGG